VSEQSLNRYVCSACGYDGFRATFRSTIETSIACFCPSCGGALFRDDALGEIEREAFASERMETA
jgi:predicted RNA-binding Zn-ribbon protein involved in translation (DUF1610 family)